MKKAIVGAAFAWLLCASFIAQANWYSGGTLHGENALAWQQASSANKLATAGDFVAALHQSGRLKPAIAQQINGVDSLRPLAQELVNQLDVAFEADPDPAENRRMFSNLQVRESATMIMVLMGWL